MGIEGLGDGNEIPRRGPGAEPRWGLRAKLPEARYIGLQTVCSCHMLFYAGLLPSPSSISPYPEKTLDLHESDDPTWARWACAGVCSPVASLLTVTQLVVSVHRAYQQDDAWL